ncbi:unnamed protein product [Orchesella dallaii]|uniref:Uncharacterized protein n=1 Tax=Orchesella dallaii TaxID=48710 RepID=A0ABP1RB28_9HEXA
MKYRNVSSVNILTLQIGLITTGGSGSDKKNRKPVAHHELGGAEKARKRKKQDMETKKDAVIAAKFFKYF